MKLQPDIITITLRLLAAPFVFGIYLIIHAWIPIKGTYLFIRYGGEFLVYMKDDRESMSKIYTQLKSQSKEAEK
jgi:hypothetical protein